MGSDAFVGEAIEERVQNAKSLLATIVGMPDAQTGFLTIRFCATYAKLVYLSSVVHPAGHNCTCWNTSRPSTPQ